MFYRKNVFAWEQAVRLIAGTAIFYLGRRRLESLPR